MKLTDEKGRVILSECKKTTAKKIIINDTINITTTHFAVGDGFIVYTYDGSLRVFSQFGHCVGNMSSQTDVRLFTHDGCVFILDKDSTLWRLGGKLTSAYYTIPIVVNNNDYVY